MYMLQQRTTTAVREGYRGADVTALRDELTEASHARAWLEGLEIDPAVRASLVEPIAAVEEALAEILRMSEPGTDGPASDG